MKECALFNKNTFLCILTPIQEFCRFFFFHFMKVFNFPLNFFHWKVSKENSIYMFIYNKCMLHSEVRCYAFNVSISLTTLIRGGVLSFANCLLNLYRPCQCILFLFIGYYDGTKFDPLRNPTTTIVLSSGKRNTTSTWRCSCWVGTRAWVCTPGYIYVHFFVYPATITLWFSIAASTKPYGCNLYSVLNRLCCWSSQREKKCDIIILNKLIRESSHWHSFAIREGSSHQSDKYISEHGRFVVLLAQKLRCLSPSMIS